MGLQPTSARIGRSALVSSQMRVIGTAGHVDHGKSTLVEALTGIHPDRLEGRTRARDDHRPGLRLDDPARSGGRRVGIVDVPGHRDFIENMLAGVGGIDAALFVVAADEGVMPQTREHLAILDLLQIHGGVVALTKIDLVDDPRVAGPGGSRPAPGRCRAPCWTMRRSCAFRRAPARASTNCMTALGGLPGRHARRARIWAARACRWTGSSPWPALARVVTGTLSDGSCKVGDEVEVLPAGLRGRVRGLQTHKQKEETAVPGSRTAVNISGVALEEIAARRRGRPPGRLHANPPPGRALPPAAGRQRRPCSTTPRSSSSSARPKSLARLRLLGSEELLPGEAGWLQLELSQPVVAVRGDRYILRRPSPGETLGGGAVVDPHPAGRHKRFSSQVLERMQALSHGTPAEVLLQALIAEGPAPLKQVLGRASLDPASQDQALQELVQTRQVVNLESAHVGDRPAPDDLVMARPAWERLASETVQIVQEYHRSLPLMPGMPRQELKSRLKEATAPSPRLFNLLVERLVEAGLLEENGPWVLQPGHAIRFNPAQQAKIDTLLKKFELNPYSPPSPKECQAEIGEDVYSALLALGSLVSVSSDVVFRQEDYAQMVAEIVACCSSKGPSAPPRCATTSTPAASTPWPCSSTWMPAASPCAKVMSEV